MNTATERGSTFVHTVGGSQLSGVAGEPGQDPPPQHTLSSTLDKAPPPLLYTLFPHPRAPRARRATSLRKNSSLTDF